MKQTKGSSGESSETTRERFVEAGRALFARQGYHATNMRTLIAEAASSSGNFYNFFSGKDDLLIEVLRSAVHDESTPDGLDPLARLRLFASAQREALLASDFCTGDPLCRVALEAPEIGAEIRRKIAAEFRRRRLELQRTIADVVPENREVGGYAAMAQAVVQGAALQAQAEGSIEPFDRAVEQFLALLVDQGR